MRLIDADKLKKDILLQNILGEPIQKIIDRYIHIVDEQPTTFDVDAVVEQLDTYITKLVGRNAALVKMEYVEIPFFLEQDAMVTKKDAD